ncbi:MAG: SDR family NAD(P)-dependent oxidoreductase [Methanobacteriota archaeon]
MRVFITGASAGIGLATARAFAKEQAELVLVARRADALRRIVEEMRQLSGKPAHALAVDVTDPSSLAAARKAHPEQFEAVDVLVNNAGLAIGVEPLQEGDPEDWDVVLDTNVKGLLRVTRAVLPGMVARGRGHVVNVGSTAGHWVYRGGAVYCASKHAVAAITEGLRLDVHGTGVRVTEVAPGLVGDTEFSAVRLRGDAAKARAVYEGMTPLSPEDVAETIRWAVTRPSHMNVQQVVLMPTDQASVRDVHRRTPRA